MEYQGTCCRGNGNYPVSRQIYHTEDELIPSLLVLPYFCLNLNHITRATGPGWHRLSRLHMAHGKRSRSRTQ